MNVHFPALDEVEAATKGWKLAMDVLVVDDDVWVRELVSERLLDDGLSVTAAPSAEAALAVAAAKGEPLVVVTDVHLGPGMDGLALAAEVHDRWPTAGVVIMTGTPAALQHHSAHEREKLLLKPFDSAPLVSAVRELMSRSAK